jgi:hypothetical protein
MFLLEQDVAFTDQFRLIGAGGNQGLADGPSLLA